MPPGNSHYYLVVNVMILEFRNLGIAFSFGALIANYNIGLLFT